MQKLIQSLPSAEDLTLPTKHGDWHIQTTQGVEGPFTAHEVRQKLKFGRITWQTLAARTDDAEWLPLSTFSDALEPRVRTVVSATRPVIAEPQEHPQFDLVKSGVVLLALAFILTLLLGMGLVEMLFIATGIILLVVGLCRK